MRTWKSRREFGGSRACFYADDGLLENTELVELQEDLDGIIKLFERVGLQTNEIKTKVMVLWEAKAPEVLGEEEYNRRWRKGGKKGRRSWKEGRNEKWRREKVRCEICGE